ncbi:MAG: hypothetical protein JNL11_07340 [Bdellovibrionaceae bacterium]|nr:hypothetical protein [Pseudobdellovibrionaceae bacterium]
MIEKDYLDLVASALKTAPEVDAEKPIAVTTIQDLILRSLADEIKICNS